MGKASKYCEWFPVAPRADVSAVSYGDAHIHNCSVTLTCKQPITPSKSIESQRLSYLFPLSLCSCFRCFGWLVCIRTNSLGSLRCLTTGVSWKSSANDTWNVRGTSLYKCTQGLSYEHPNKNVSRSLRMSVVGSWSEHYKDIHSGLYNTNSCALFRVAGLNSELKSRRRSPCLFETKRGDTPFSPLGSKGTVEALSWIEPSYTHHRNE